MRFHAVAVVERRGDARGDLELHEDVVERERHLPAEAQHRDLPVTAQSPRDPRADGIVAAEHRDHPLAHPRRAAEELDEARRPRRTFGRGRRDIGACFP